MENLNENELREIKRMFILTANNNLKNKENLLVLCSIYSKITQRDLKKDWEEWDKKMKEIMGMKS